MALTTRFFRSTIVNDVQNTTLVRRDMRLCGGDWTPGWNPPPPQIPAGGQASWQSESGGLWQGTQGWVKYDVIGSAGEFRGMVYLYWTNPFWGVTRADYGLTNGDHRAACDDEDTDDSTFGGETDSTAGLVLSATEIRSSGVSPDRVEEYLLSPHAPWLLSVLHWGGTVERMQVVYRLTEVGAAPASRFPPRTKASTLRLDTTPDPAHFPGTWTGEGVRVRVATTGVSQFDVRVDDEQSPALHLHETVTFGPGAEIDVMKAKLSDVQFLEAAGRSVRSPDVLSLLEVTKSPRFARARSRPPELSDVHVSSSPPVAQAIDRAPWIAGVVETAAANRHALLVAGQVSLSLVDVLDEDGEVMDQKLLYQRLGGAGFVVHQEHLTHELPIH